MLTDNSTHNHTGPVLPVATLPIPTKPPHPAPTPTPSDKDNDETRRKIIAIIDHQFDLEIVMKHRELAAIQDEIAKAEDTLDDLRLAIVNELVHPDPDLNHHNTRRARLHNDFPMAAGSSSVGGASRRKISDHAKRHGKAAAAVGVHSGKAYLFARRADGTFVSWKGGFRCRPIFCSPLSRRFPTFYDTNSPPSCRYWHSETRRLACPRCKKDDFTNQQGFVNHCRLAHGLEFANYEETVRTSGIPVDESEVPPDHASRHRPVMKSVVANGVAKQAVPRPTIKEFDEEVNLDDDPSKSAAAGPSTTTTTTTTTDGLRRRRSSLSSSSLPSTSSSNSSSGSSSSASDGESTSSSSSSSSSGSSSFRSGPELEPDAPARAAAKNGPKRTPVMANGVSRMEIDDEGKAERDGPGSGDETNIARRREENESGTDDENELTARMEALTQGGAHEVSSARVLAQVGTTTSRGQLRRRSSTPAALIAAAGEAGRTRSVTPRAGNASDAVKAEGVAVRVENVLDGRARERSRSRSGTPGSKMMGGGDKRGEMRVVTAMGGLGLGQVRGEDDGSRFYVKKRVVIGNVSKFVPKEKRDPHLAKFTHKWMVYVVGPPNAPPIATFVSRVRFHLHPSYHPHDVVDVNVPPFHLTRYGWGEFPLRVRLFFVDRKNKPVDVIHVLKVRG
ncbi:yeats family-domain-containing protein [Jimgerdemannia flammicorona]|uniref:Yeats family-domain-containing protein n=1 Tax=Jimgerdemannia flammicorona TaxID=994334 RepID=A0A433Q568_9FUNG|nr:yeats family-domain-containing protein [Jimgerdemannia flammicorona]